MFLALSGLVLDFCGVALLHELDGLGLSCFVLICS